jgi:large subunit ribosomal protein L18
MNKRTQTLNARKQRVRKHLKAISDRPRLHVFRSNQYIYAQVIDDTKGVTIASASSKELDDKKLSKIEKATLVGELIADRSIKNKVKKVKFDRGSYKFHGRVKALAEAARNKGLEF